MRSLYILSCIVILSFAALNWYSMNKNEEKASVIIGFTGDVMLGRLVNEKLQEAPFTYPWGDMLPLILKPDITIINLETTLTKSQKAVPKVFNFRSDPKNVNVLKVANINVVSLANNHTKDFGNEGLQDTINALDQKHILHVGAGLNKADAQKAVIITHNNIRIGILGATDNEPTWAATKTSPGINYFSVEHPEELFDSIKNVRKQVDILILSLHWGPNMRERPTQPYINAAHAFIDAGVDIIHGHSAHIFQGIEIYKEKLILYDTGDFIDDYHVDIHLRNDHSFFYIVEVTKNGIQSFQVIPVQIKNMQVNRATNPEYSWSMERIQMLSQEFGTTINKDGLWRATKPLIES